MAELRVIGTTPPRVDGFDKVTGATRYSADVALPGTLVGKVLRSTMPHARIVRIETAAARALPGVRAVLTARDLADPERKIGRRVRDVPLLAHRRVRYVGEAVAAVAAESIEAAEEALGLIEVEYDELPAVFDPELALASGAPVLHPEIATYVGLPADRPADAPPNLQGWWSSAAGDLEAGLVEAEVVFEATYGTPAIHQGHIEPHAVTAQIQADGSLDIWLSNKTPFTARRHLVDALDLPAGHVRVHPAAIGGDFGGKGSVMHAPLAALLSRASGRPVRLVLTYVEELQAANPRHAASMRLRVGARRDGTLTALEADLLLDGGAYAGMKPHASAIVGGVTKVAGPYRIPNTRLRARVAYTNTVPRGHMRSPGEPQAIFARELMLDELARRLELDPVELRRRNLLADGEMRASGGRWVHPTAPLVLERAAEAIGWGAPRRPNVGRGLALTERSVGTGASNAILRIDLDGRVELLTGLPDTGTGAHTILQQIVAEVLTLPAEAVKVRIGGTDEAPPDAGAGGSRVSHVAGQAAFRAATAAADRVKQLAAETFGWQENEVTLVSGRVGSSSQAEESRTLAAALQAFGETIETRGEYAFEDRIEEQSFSVQAAEVEVDPEAGQVTVRRIATVHDVGTVLNPLTHQGQIEGGLIQGFGMALMEDLPIGRDDGRVGATSLGDYKLPNLEDVPPLETILVPGGYGPVPFGGKGVGENSNCAITPAIANAVLDAVGVAIRDLPVSAEKVRAALRERQTDHGPQTTDDGPSTGSG